MVCQFKVKVLLLIVTSKMFETLGHTSGQLRTNTNLNAQFELGHQIRMSRACKYPIDTLPPTLPHLLDCRLAIYLRPY